MLTQEKIELPKLPYAYNALEPVISEKIMKFHHDKHHAAYVTKYNEALDAYEKAESRGDLSAMIALFPALKFNGGGHINHSIFWTNLAPQSAGGGEPPVGPLADSLKHHFGSLEAFIKEFNSKAAPIQGSGWAWLGYDSKRKTLTIDALSNQDPLQATTGRVPLLGIDVWEHAYYIDYGPGRLDYLNEIWKVVNWSNVSERYIAAL